MKKLFYKLPLMMGVICSTYASAYATSITTIQNNSLSVSEDSEIISITGNGSIEVDTDNTDEAGINNSSSSPGGSFANTAISIDTTSSSKGIVVTGNTAGAISFLGAGSSLASLTIDSGTVSSENTSDSDGTINISGDDSTSPIINVGKDSGTSGTIRNSGVGGNAIYASSLNTNLTINNKATGTISSAGNAIKLDDGFGLSTLTLNNAGNITAASGYKAISLNGYQANITNSGTITGDIDLGSSSDSSLTLSGGTVAGNVLMGDSSQNIILNGGNLDSGSINGSGTVTVDANTVLGGSIGDQSAVSLLNISSSANLSLASNSYTISASKISIDAGAAFTANYNNFTTDEVDGVSDHVGTLNVNFTDNSEVEIPTLYGTTNGLEAVNFAGNLSDGSKSSIIKLVASVNATNTTIQGIGSILRLSSGNNINGNVIIGDQSNFQLDDNSSVTGTIEGIEQYKGNLQIINSHSDPAAVSSVTLNGNIGGNSKDLHSIIAGYNTYIDAATNNVAINAQNIYLSSLSNLVLGTGTVTGTIKGFTFFGSNNGFGNVIFNDNNTLGGDIGTSNGNAINTITLNSSITVDTGSFGLNAKNINLEDSAILNSSGLISGGDNDDNGATFSDSAISLGNNSTLNLNSGSSLYGSVNSSGSTNTTLNINTALNSSNSHINIGDTSQITKLSLLDGATLDVTGNNGTVKANEISLGDGSTLKLGNAEIVGTIDGSADNLGILDIEGDVTLDGTVGSTHSLNIFNIGTVGSGGYNVTALDSISSTNITLNGDLTSLSIADDKSVNGDVVMSGTAELSVGDGTSVNGTIKGNNQYEGILTIREGATFAAGGNIGADDKDLGLIKIQGILDLSGLSSYQVYTQIFSLTENGVLTIGSGLVVGDIQGYNSGNVNGSTNGIGKGSVIFAANNSSFAGTIGSNDGHAINELSILSSKIVNTNSANINANRITLHDNSSLTSSASLISGGNNSSDTGLIGTIITLNNQASLTLNNVDLFLGTIDGNDDGEGNLTLNGSYGNDTHADTINIGSTKKLAQITLEDSTTLDVSRFNGIVKADAIILNENSVLTTGSGDIVGTVDGDADDHGTLTILGDTTLHSSIGSDHKLLALNVGNSGTTVEVTANASINASNISILGASTSLTIASSSTIIGDITLGANSRLNLNDADNVIGEIHGAAKYNGELNIFSSSSVIANNNIGSGGFDLALVAILNGATLDLNTNDISLNSESISMIDDSTLIVGSKTVTGAIKGYNSNIIDSATHGAGKGNIIFANNNTIGGDIGNNTGNAVNSITISSSKTVNAGSFSLYSKNITVNNNAILETSGTVGGGDNLTASDQIASTISLYNNTSLVLSDGASLFATINLVSDDPDATSIANITTAGSVNIAGDINVRELGTLNIHNSAFLNIGAINGSADNVGIVTISDGGTSTLSNDIGSVHALSALYINENSALNAYTNNASVIAQNIYLDNGASIIMSAGALSGTVHGFGDADSISFSGSSTHTLSGDLGVASDTAGIGTITLQGTLNTGSYNIRSNNFTFDATEAVLSFGGGNIDIASFINNNAAHGIINFTANNNINFVIDADNQIEQLNISDDATVTQNQNISASNTTIGSGNSGKLIIAEDKSLNGNIRINSGANLTLNNNSIINGEITGASSAGTGTFEIAGITVSAFGNIGTANNKIDLVKINTNSTFNLGNYNLVANTTSLASGANLQIGAGAINSNILGNIDGNGTIQFMEDNSLLKNIGNSNHKVSEVIISDGKTLTSNKAIYANNIALSSNSTLELLNGSSVNSIINGSALGYGNINTSGNVSLGAIGTTYSINNLTVNTGSITTFSGNIFAANDININGSAIFTNAAHSISTNSFNLNSGSSLSLSMNLNSPATNILEVTGQALVSSNSNLNLTVSGSAVSGTRFTLINASNPSTIETIADAKINLNNSGSNIRNHQTYITSVFENELLLTIVGDFVPTALNFPSSNLQNSYDTISNIPSTTGNLSAVKDFLTNDSNSLEQKAEILKSVTPQVNNSSNLIAFSNSQAVANIVSARLESLRTNIISPQDNSAFTNNNSKNISFAQILNPLRDNKFKASYPLSYNLANDNVNNPSNKAIWVQTFNNNLNQGNTNLYDGYKANSQGVTFGTDYKFMPNLTLGLSSGISKSITKSSNENKSTDIDSYQFGIYNGYNSQKYFLNNTIGVALNNYNSNRYISTVNSSAKAKYNGKSYMASSEMGSYYRLEHNLILTPTFTLTAAHNSIANYSEDGAGSLDLEIKNNSTNFLEGRLGTELSKIFWTKQDTQINPRISLSYAYNFIGDPQKTNSTFIGQNINFTSESDKIPQGSLKLGAGISFYTKENLSFSTNYWFEYRANFISNSLGLRAGYSFLTSSMGHPRF